MSGIKIVMPKGESRSDCANFIKSVFPDIDLDSRCYNQSCVYLTRAPDGAELVFDRPFSKVQADAAVTVMDSALNYLCKKMSLDESIKKLNQLKNKPD